MMRKCCFSCNLFLNPSIRFQKSVTLKLPLRSFAIETDTTPSKIISVTKNIGKNNDPNDGGERQILLKHFQRSEATTEVTILDDKNNNISKKDDETARAVVVSVMTMNRPKANAMGTTMLSQFKETLTELEQQYQENLSTSSLLQSRCLVLTSFSSKVFSAGADLKERSAMTVDEAGAYVTELRNTFDRLSRLPIPVIAAVEGIALGGGFELALAADIRVASSTAVFGFPETSLAIIPGAGGTQRLPRLIGSAGRAKDLIWTSRRIDAVVAAEQFGIVERVVEPGQALEAAMDLAWLIATNAGPVAIRASKRAIDDGIECPNMVDALETERLAYNQVLATQDRLEGLAAFREGRIPKYRGV